MTTQPIHVACLTPAGTGAIATVALIGPDAWSLLETLLHPPSTPPSSGAILLARIGDEATDQAVLTLDEQRNEQRIEIHCHGGPAVVRWLTDLLVERGAAEIDFRRFVRLTSPTVIRAEATLALAQAKTAAAAGVLLDQFHGASERAIQDTIESLQENHICQAVEILDSLLRWERFSQHLIEPWRVVLAGAPNVGKSTLLNALAGYRRSITDPTPGTTRDVVRVETAFAGWPVELIDTAGVRDAATGVEAMGIARSLAACREADLVLWLLDVSQPQCPPPPGLGRTTILVLNKIDLPAKWSAESLAHGQNAVSISAERGDGLGKLIDVMVNALVPSRPPPEASVPIGAPVFAALRAARDEMAAGRSDVAMVTLSALLAPLVAN